MTSLPDLIVELKYASKMLNKEGFEDSVIYINDAIRILESLRTYELQVTISGEDGLDILEVQTPVALSTLAHGIGHKVLDLVPPTITDSMNIKQGVPDRIINVKFVTGPMPSSPT
jgi:hypothetical protein